MSPNLSGVLGLALQNVGVKSATEDIRCGLNKDSLKNGSHNASVLSVTSQPFIFDTYSTQQRGQNAASKSKLQQPRIRSYKHVSLLRMSQKGSLWNTAAPMEI